MSRRCALTGKGVQTGHRVSHSNIKTLRRFLPNLTTVSFYSEKLKQSIRLRVATSTIRTVEKNGGLDSWLLTAKDKVLSDEARKIKRRIRKAEKKQA